MKHDIDRIKPEYAVGIQARGGAFVRLRAAILNLMTRPFINFVVIQNPDSRGSAEGVK